MLWFQFGLESYITSGVAALCGGWLRDQQSLLNFISLGCGNPRIYEAQLRAVSDRLSKDDAEEVYHRLARSLLLAVDERRQKSVRVRREYARLLGAVLDTKRCEKLDGAVEVVMAQTERCQDHLSWRCQQIATLASILASSLRAHISDRFVAPALRAWFHITLVDPTFDGVAEPIRLAAARSLPHVGPLLTTLHKQEALRSHLSSVLSPVCCFVLVN